MFDEGPRLIFGAEIVAQLACKFFNSTAHRSFSVVRMRSEGQAHTFAVEESCALIRSFVRSYSVPRDERVVLEAIYPCAACTPQLIFRDSRHKIITFASRFVNQFSFPITIARFNPLLVKHLHRIINT